MVDHSQGSFPSFPQQVQVGIGGNLTSAIQGHGQVPLGKTQTQKCRKIWPKMDPLPSIINCSQTHKKTYGNGRKRWLSLSFVFVSPQLLWSYRTLHMTGDKVPLCKWHDNARHGTWQNFRHFRRSATSPGCYAAC